MAKETETKPGEWGETGVCFPLADGGEYNLGSRKRSSLARDKKNPENVPLRRQETELQKGKIDK